MKTKKHFLITAVMLLFSAMTYSQSVTIGTEEFTAHPSAILEMKSTSQGVLIPRMTLSDRGTIPVNSLSAGLLIYQTDQVQGFYYYDGSAWKSLSVVFEDGTAVVSHDQTLSISGDTIFLSGGGFVVLPIPTISDLFSGSWEDLTNKPELFSGLYEDLIGLPDIPQDQVLSIRGDTIFLTGGGYVKLPAMAVGFSGKYEDLVGIPAVFDSNYNALKNKPDFHTIAISGDYYDLTNKPVLFSGSYADLENKPTFHDVAISGLYQDLEGLPVLSPDQTLSINEDTIFLSSGGYVKLPAVFDSNYNALKNVPNYSDTIANVYNDLRIQIFEVGTEIGNLLEDIDNRVIGFDGNYESLINKPTLFSGEYSDLTGIPIVFDSNYNALKNLPCFEDSIVKYGFDGDYQSLTNVPIEFTPVSHIHAVNDITDFPTLSTVATTGNYDDLTGKPILFNGNYNNLTNRPDIDGMISTHDNSSLSHADIRQRLIELQAEINELLSALDQKSNVGHTHTRLEITDFTHTHTTSDVGLGNVVNERQYSASNPPPYPVTSVNDRTGTVSGLVENTDARLTDARTPTAHNQAFSTIDNLQQDRLLGRTSTGRGFAEELTAAQTRAFLNVADGANNYIHPAYNQYEIEFSGARVLDYIYVCNQGHVAKLATRDLTATDIGAAPTSHGNHIPAVQTANNAVFLRNDNTWQTITPNNIGGVANNDTRLSDARTPVAHNQAFSTINNVQQNRILGRTSTGTGTTEDLTPAQVRTVLNIADGANNYVHPEHTARNSAQSDASVYSNVIVDEQGHVTGLTTRLLSALNISSASNITTAISNQSSNTVQNYQTTGASIPSDQRPFSSLFAERVIFTIYKTTNSVHVEFRVGTRVFVAGNHSGSTMTITTASWRELDNRVLSLDI